MRRYFLSVLIVVIFQVSLFPQVLVNEIFFKNDSIIIIELCNKSLTDVKVNSLTFISDSVFLTSGPQDISIQPSKLGLVELKLLKDITELNKVNIQIETDLGQYLSDFKGCILRGESAGRYPDSSGDFIIYNNSQISPGFPNMVPGILVKKTSKTKFTPRDSSPNAALFYNNQYWIFGGWDYNSGSDTYSSKPNVWKSADGLDWTLVNASPPYSPYSNFVVFNNKMMIYTGDTVFMSEDGVTWDRHLCNTFYYENYRFVVFKNKLYVNSFDMMYESEDGINWTQRYTDFPWEEIRYLPALVSSGDRLWLYGGMEGYNDVWSSSDGLHWVKILDKAPWSPRIWFNFTYYDNKLWMIDGSDQNLSDTVNFGNKRDFWYSSDGINWKQLETDSAFQNRHASFLWNDGKRVLISSGFGNMLLSRMHNDVWELDASVSLTSSKGADMQTLCINTQLTEINYSIAGAAGATITGLPHGVSGSYVDGKFTISGSPADPGLFNYTITPTGPYVLPSASGAIKVNPNPEITLSSREVTNAQLFYINSPIEDIKYTLTGTSDVTITGLPPGVRGYFADSVVIIRGRPVKSGTFNYKIDIKGQCSISSESGKIKVYTVRIFPNPTHGKLTILNTNGFSLSIFDISGHQIFHNSFPADQSVFEKDFSDVLKTDGVYLFVIKENDSGEIYSQKVVYIH